MPGFGFGPSRRRRMAAGVSFALPAQANLVFHLNADAITPQTDNTALPSWTDTASGIVFAQATGSAQPKYRTSGAGGKACVEFVSSHSLLCLTANQGALKTAIDSREYSVLVVVDNIQTATSGAGACIFGKGGGGTFHILGDNQNVGQQGFGAPINPSLPWSNTGFMTYGMTGTLSSSERGSGPLIRHYARGLPYCSNNSNPLQSGAATWGVGSKGDGTFGLKGRIYRILAWNRKLTPAEMWQAEQYINAYYGQTHPAVTKGKLLVFDGDSRTNGEGATITGNGFAYKTANGLGFPPGSWCNFAISSITIAQSIVKNGELDHLAGIGVPIRGYYEEHYNSRNVTGGLGSAPPSGAASTSMANQTWQQFQAMRTKFGAGAKLMGATPLDLPATGEGTVTSAAWASYIAANSVDIGMDTYSDTRAAMGTCPDVSPGAPNWTNDLLHLADAGHTIMSNTVQAAYTAASF